MINLDEKPWFYIAHVLVGGQLGHLELAFERRLTTPDDIALLRVKVADTFRIPLPGVVLTGLTLVSGPDDREDPEGYEQQRAIVNAAHEVVEAWAGVSRTHRTLIGDQMGFTDLANALDGLLQAVRDATDA